MITFDLSILSIFDHFIEFNLAVDELLVKRRGDLRRVAVSKGLIKSEKLLPELIK
jgi:hypothetical protein